MSDENVKGQNYLFNHFSELFYKFNHSTILKDEVYSQICQYYLEKHRYYHGLSHIYHCLKMFDLIEDTLDKQAHNYDMNALKLAIWFHDIIYDVGANDNELRSQIKADDIMMAIGVESKLREYVCRIINSTDYNLNHKFYPTEEIKEIERYENRIKRYMIDIDLSAFSLPPEQYHENSKRVELEILPFYNKIEYLVKRKHFLNKVRNEVYGTDYFNKNYAHLARINIDFELKLIDKKLRFSDE